MKDILDHNILQIEIKSALQIIIDPYMSSYSSPSKQPGTPFHTLFLKVLELQCQHWRTRFSLRHYPLHSKKEHKIP